MKTFKLKIATPEAVCFDGPAENISVRGTEGDLAVMAGHIPFVTAVSEGNCRIHLPGGEIRDAECGDGLLTVSGEETVFLSSYLKWKDEDSDAGSRQ